MLPVCGQNPCGSAYLGGRNVVRKPGVVGVEKGIEAGEILRR